VITIRQFQPKDMFAVLKLASDTLTEQYNPSLFIYFYETYPEGFIIAEKNQKIIGFIIGVKISPQNTKILMLAVTETQQRQKIGTALLNQFLNKIIKDNIKNIELEVRTDNKRAIKFYEKHNFKITKEISHFYQNGENAYTMKLEF
jgi:ribosomal-protein-alanine N-acetyltransferase